MREYFIIAIIVLFIVSGCRHDTSKVETTMNQFIIEDQITTVSYRDGRTGEEYEIADQSLVDFREVFDGATFVGQEDSEDKTGYIFRVTIETDVGQVEFSGPSDVIIYGESMSFISSKRYSDIVSFLEEYKDKISE